MSDGYSQVLLFCDDFLLMYTLVKVKAWKICAMLSGSKSMPEIVILHILAELLENGSSVPIGCLNGA